MGARLVGSGTRDHVAGQAAQINHCRRVTFLRHDAADPRLGSLLQNEPWSTLCILLGNVGDQHADGNRTCRAHLLDFSARVCLGNLIGIERVFKYTVKPQQFLPDVAD